MPGVISKRGHRHVPKILSKKAKQMMSDDKFKARMAKCHLTPINKNYDIPYLAGYSNDGKTVYIDRHLKTKWNGVDLTHFLRIHECAEKAILDIDHLTYQEAHHIATHLERQAVEQAGLSWKEYSAYLDPYIKKVHHEHLDNVPKDLDLQPYADEKDKKVLKDLMAKQHVKKVVSKTVRENVGLTETKISLEYHDQLNPKLWIDFELKPEIKTKLIDFGYAWADFAMIPRSMIKDIIILGGNANYNYTNKSDIDVHIIIDRYKLPANKPMVDDYLQSKKMLWTLTHNITILGLPVEPYAQDSSAPYPENQGVYSLLKGQWIQKPIKKNIDFKNDPNLKKKVMFYNNLINSMIRGKMDAASFKDLKNKISNMRAAAIAQGGEFSFENLVFKELRNRGLLDKMNKYMGTLHDKELSL